MQAAGSGLWGCGMWGRLRFDLDAEVCGLLATASGVGVAADATAWGTTAAAAAAA